MAVYRVINQLHKHSARTYGARPLNLEGGTRGDDRKSKCHKIISHQQGHVESMVNHAFTSQHEVTWSPRSRLLKELGRTPSEFKIKFEAVYYVGKEHFKTAKDLLQCLFPIIYGTTPVSDFGVMQVVIY
jgi:hypothetical protein